MGLAPDCEGIAKTVDIAQENALTITGWLLNDKVPFSCIPDDHGFVIDCTFPTSKIARQFYCMNDDVMRWHGKRSEPAYLAAHVLEEIGLYAKGRIEWDAELQAACEADIAGDVDELISKLREE